MSLRGFGRGRWLVRLVGTLVVGVPLVLAGCDDDGTEPGIGAEVTVMSRNVYLGANIFELAEAESQQELVVVAGQMYAHVEETDFPERADALAAEIEAADPALVGLQEVSLYRVQAESDFQATLTPNAETVTFDFLQLLLDALADRGLDYRMASQVENADSELPAVLDPTDPTQLSDVRLTDYDVILARGDVAISNPRAENFVARAQVPAGGFTVPFSRGWTAVDAVVDGARLTFVNTHVEGLEPAHEDQILELLEEVEPMQGRVILVGDLNTQADLSGTPGYRLVVVDGPFTDPWTEVGTGPGYTCCFAADLVSDTRELDERIDFVLYRGALQPLSAEVVGDEEADRTPSGLRPSDHAGVVVTFEAR